MPFTSSAWESPESGMDAGAFCACCLIDLNEGREKVKGNCKLPIRSTPGGPINLNAMAAAAAALAGARGGVDAPAEKKRSAARRLKSLYREAGKEPPESLSRVGR
jgi:hypothetical protein